MTSGRRKTPTAVLERRGSRHMGNRTAEPKPSNGAPVAPEWLSENAKIAWSQHADELVGLGLLTLVDDFSYALLCQAYADYVEAVELVRENGLIATSDKGSVYQHPAVGIMNKAAERLMKACREFGLTPSARSGMNVAPPDGKPSGLESKFNIVG